MSSKFSQLHKARIESRTGIVAQYRTLVWTTNRGKKRAMKNFLNYVLDVNPDYVRVEIEPAGPECYGLPI